MIKLVYLYCMSVRSICGYSLLLICLHKTKDTINQCWVTAKSIFWWSILGLSWPADYVLKRPTLNDMFIHQETIELRMRAQLVQAGCLFEAAGRSEGREKIYQEIKKNKCNLQELLPYLFKQQQVAECFFFWAYSQSRKGSIDLYFVLRDQWV